MKAPLRLGRLAPLDDEAQVDLVRSKADHLDVDVVECSQGLAGDARGLEQSLPDEGDDRAVRSISATSPSSARSACELGVDACSRRPSPIRSPRRSTRGPRSPPWRPKASKMLARKPAPPSMRGVRHGYHGDRAPRGEGGDRLPRGRFAGDRRESAFGHHAVANGHRYAQLDRGEDGRRMEDLRAEGRKLGGLVVAQELDGPGLRHDAGIAGEDALDVGPDLDLGGADRGSEEAGAVVRASAARGWSAPRTRRPLCSPGSRLSCRDRREAAPSRRRAGLSRPTGAWPNRSASPCGSPSSRLSMERP